MEVELTTAELNARQFLHLPLKIDFISHTLIMERFEKNRRLGRRREHATVRESKRGLVTFREGNITITSYPTASQPTVPPKKPHSLFPPPPSKPFSALFPANQPPKSNPSPQFSSFADLYKGLPSSSASYPIPLSQKGILPLPKEGWTKVIYKKNHRKPNLLSVRKNPLPPVKPKRRYLCGDRAHMARSCSLGDFKCFACNKIGHTSVCCPNKKNPPLHSFIPPSPTPPPLFIPSITLPPSVIENMEAFS